MSTRLLLLSLLLGIIGLHSADGFFKLPELPTLKPFEFPKLKPLELPQLEPLTVSDSEESIENPADPLKLSKLFKPLFKPWKDVFDPQHSKTKDGKNKDKNHTLNSKEKHHKEHEKPHNSHTKSNAEKTHGHTKNKIAEKSSEEIHNAHNSDESHGNNKNQIKVVKHKKTDKKDYKNENIFEELEHLDEEIKEGFHTNIERPIQDLFDQLGGHTVAPQKHKCSGKGVKYIRPYGGRPSYSHESDEHTDAMYWNDPRYDVEGEYPIKYFT